MIEKYQYGSMTIQGTQYPSDLILYPDTIDPHWRRKHSYRVGSGDVMEMLTDERPEYLVIGTGDAGSLDVSPEVQNHLQAQGINLVYAPTEEARLMYNMLCPRHRVVGAFHLKG